MGVDFALGGKHEPALLVAHLRPEFVLEVVVVARARLQLVAREVPHVHLVVVLELALVRVVLLHRVVRQVHQRVRQVRQGLLARVRAHLAVFEELRAQHAVQRGKQALDADVELAALDQHGFFDVLLHHPVRLLRLRARLRADFLERAEHLDACAAVAAAPRFDDPDFLRVAGVEFAEFIPRFRPGTMIHVKCERQKRFI